MKVQNDRYSFLFEFEIEKANKQTPTIVSKTHISESIREHELLNDFKVLTFKQIAREKHN